MNPRTRTREEQRISTKPTASLSTAIAVEPPCSERPSDHFAPVFEAMSLVKRTSTFVVLVHVEDESVKWEILFAHDFYCRIHQLVCKPSPPVFRADVNLVEDASVPDHRQPFGEHEHVANEHLRASTGTRRKLDDRDAPVVLVETPRNPFKISCPIRVCEFVFIRRSFILAAGVAAELEFKCALQVPECILIARGSRVVGSDVHDSGSRTEGTNVAFFPTSTAHPDVRRPSTSGFDTLLAVNELPSAMSGDRSPREDLSLRIAGEITLSDDPGATIRKWRTDFDVSQTELAKELDVSSSVISDYESGRRASPGIGLVERLVTSLLDLDERRGGARLRQYARVISAGFEGDVVRDLREYPASVGLDRFYDTIGADELVSGDRDTVSGHTVINSVEAIKSLTGDEFYRLYGNSTNRALIFSEVTRGESPLVAMRVVNPTPSAVVLHGISRADLWEHAPALARVDGFSLAVCNCGDEALLDALSTLP